MKSIAIIVCFLGKTPNYFGLFLKSVAANPSIDFYQVGEMDLSGLVVPTNFHIKRYTLDELTQVAREALGVPDASISVPYKTGDYRPMFGEMFADWLKEYDVWGYCDVDIVFGDLRKFLTDEKLEKYDKIYPHGHLSLYKNTPDVNARWRLPDARYDVHTVMTSPEVFAFDEWRGIHNIYMRNKFPFYRTVEYASPATNLHRYHFENRSDKKYEPHPDNYKQMCFYWENGRLLRAYNAGTASKPDVREDEFVYMHFQRRRFPDPTPEVYTADAFFCTPDGFVVKNKPGIPTVEELERYNPMFMGCVLGEYLSLLWARLKRHYGRTMKRFFHRKGSFASRELQIQENRHW